MKWVAIGILTIVIIAGCAQAPQGPQAAKAQDKNLGGVEMTSIVSVASGDTVKVEYIGKFPDGNVFDKSEGRGPLEFTTGAGQMIKGFDDAVIGMKLDEEKTVTIQPENAYGKADSGQKIEVPVEEIGDDGNLSIGGTLYAGNGMQGTIVDINNGIVTLEFKHPLAGKVLVFWIKVVDIQKN